MLAAFRPLAFSSSLIAHRSSLRTKPLLILAVALLASIGHAATLKILDAERMELRNENGEELIVLTGSPVKLDRDGELIEASRVIYNRTQKRLMLSGGVRYKDKQGQVIQAENLDLDTSNESFEAISVKIESGDFYLSGPVCQRAAGQILLQKGYLTPCQRCAAKTPDYAFQAEEVVLYPGDRIIARGVWLLVSGQRTVYLPALLIYLSERRPRIDIGSNSADGTYVFFDLPYVSDFGLGYTFLRYFQNRGWGIGFDQFGVGAAKERYQFLYLPGIASSSGSDTYTSDGVWVYNLQYRLDSGNWRYTGSVKRDDFSSVSNGIGDPFGSFGGQPDLTEFKLEAATSTDVPGLPEPLYRVTLDGYIDHNKNLNGITRQPRSTPQRLPEVEVKFPSGYRTNLFSINGTVQAGFYEGPSNPFNRTARNTPYLAAGRLYLEHNEQWNPLPPWGGFSFSLTNNFKGSYYTTRNSAGEFERLINWQTTAALGQTLGPVRFGLNLRRNIIEGGSPFAFDFPGRAVRDTKLTGTFDYNPDPAFSFNATATRDLQARVFDPFASLTVVARPAPWFNLTNRVSRDIQVGKWGLLTTNLDITPQPFNFNLSYTRNLDLGLSNTLSARAGYNPLPWAFNALTGYQWTDVQEKENRAVGCDPNSPSTTSSTCILAYNRYNPLQLSTSYRPENFEFSLQHSRDLNTGAATNTSLGLFWRDGSEGVQSLEVRQNLTHLNFPLPAPGAGGTRSAVPFSLNGTLKYTYGLSSFTLNENNVVFGNPEIPGLANAGTADLTLTYQYGTDTSLSLNGVWYYLQRTVKNPTLTFRTTLRDPSLVLNEIYAQYHLPEADDPNTPYNENRAYLQTLRFSGEADVFRAPLRQGDPPGLSFQGTLNATRQQGGDLDGNFLVTLQDFGPTLSFVGEENTRLFLSLFYTTDPSQLLYLPNFNAVLKPKVVMTVDRCCWAFQGTFDTLNNEIRFSFIVGGSAADLFANKNGFGFGLPTGTTTGGTR